MTAAANPEADAITREIDRTRAQLRDTVDALVVRVSPRIQAQRATAQTLRAVSSRPTLSATAAVGVVTLVVGVPIWRRSR